MSYQFNISDIGLRLIKAYEGFWPEARSLMSGGQVVGFGHRVASDEAVSLSEDEAEDVLKADLAPIEDLINSRVHASMTQSQFDALCSLIFSIGEEAFLASDMLHALNQGQVLQAANEFDLWRKGNVDGKIYVVDALVRRRTAEKALFLRPTQRIARAPRFELAPVRDGGWNPSLNTSTDTSSFASQQAYSRPAEARRPQAPLQVPAEKKSQLGTEPLTPRRELAAPPAKVLYEDEPAEDILDDLTVNPVMSAELDISDELPPLTASQEPVLDPIEISVADLLDEVDDNEAGDEPASMTSPIAEAAAAVSQRLDALIDDNTPAQQGSDEESWPDSLITSSITPVDAARDNVVQLSETGNAADVVIDELQKDDALREQIARESQYNLDRYDNYVDMPEDTERGKSFWMFVAMIVFGLVSALTGLAVNLKGSAAILGENGPFIAIAAMLLGGLLFVVGVLYLMKLLFAQE